MFRYLNRLKFPSQKIATFFCVCVVGKCFKVFNGLNFLPDMCYLDGCRNAYNLHQSNLGGVPCLHII